MYWQKPNELYNELPNLSRPQVLSFVAACVTRLLRTRHAIFKERVPQEKISIVEEIVQAYLAAVNGSRVISSSDVQRILQSLEQIRPEEDSNESLVSGWDDTIIAVCEAFRCLHGDSFHEHGRRAIAGCYEATMQEVINQWMLEAVAKRIPFGDKELIQAQEESPFCQAEYTYQLEWLERVKRGEAFPQAE